MGQSNAVRFAKFGGPDAFTSAVQSFAPGTINWIDCSVGGTGIAQWQKNSGDGLYQACMESVKGKYIDVILWEQGEAEAEQCCEDVAFAWTPLFTNMINTFRFDIGNPRAVVLYARLGQAKGLPMTGQVREAQELVHIQNGHMVDLDGIDVPAGLHYEPYQYPVIAKRFAEAYKLFLRGE